MEDDSIVCRKCGAIDYTRAGFVNGVQRYRCKKCGYHFTLNQRGVSPDRKRLALHMYIEGLGFRAIGRLLGVSDVAVAKWIGPLRPGLDNLRKTNTQMDELNKYEHFFLTKELFNKYGWLLIGTEENEGVCLLGSYTIGNRRLY